MKSSVESIKTYTKSRHIIIPGYMGSYDEYKINDPFSFQDFDFNARLNRRFDALCAIGYFVVEIVVGTTREPFTASLMIVPSVAGIDSFVNPKN
ncbi:hypothetical protein KGM_208002 [Danaus plexippus plexippus]|uniref:Uncharacterized protein n=1 Tax=Danaus plexippus plexippus TaxID=278856 RepID=A0A212FAQ6_DANPL|nr:hypothetical protein KGM_208002 [Danaus plexippus plexippus]